MSDTVLRDDTGEFLPAQVLLAGVDITDHVISARIDPSTGLATFWGKPSLAAMAREFVDDVVPFSIKAGPNGPWYNGHMRTGGSPRSV